ncbi:hypothetical protein MNBD_GAMMA18-2002 [hydrothermal vent metagenome]|uniref:DUF7939 domain-containing protein n=1 Tax=hydrothermal vent metagenome TaxID=652676 RepID=A0A3B0ZP15_9ZZZZ
MVRPHQLCLLVILLIIALPLQAASLQATVDRNPISENETVQLTLTLRDYDGPINPDLTALEGLFDILGSQQSSQVSIINGRMDSTKQLHITLAPKQTGRLVIPSIDIGTLQSQPITLQVVKSASQQAGQISEIALEVEVDNTSPYRQQQVILTVRLIHAVNLAEGVLPDPEIPGVEIHKLGEDNGYQTVRDGRRLGVIERRYALLPQQSGEITIPRILFRGRAQERGMGSFGGLFSQGRQLQARSRPITLNVKPQPQRNSGIPWLPAKNLTLQVEWSPKQPQFRVGEPITRTLTLQALGLSANQLPELSLTPQEGFKVYPDQPQLKTDTHQQGVIGTRIEKYAIVPTKVGEITLPPINLTWWNSEQNRLSVIKLPAEIIQVLAATAESNPTALPLPAVNNTESAATIIDNSTLWPWQLASALLALAWLITLWLWWRKAPQPAPLDRRQTADSSSTLRISLNDIANTCRHNQPEKTRDALLAWGQTHNPQQPPHSLIELAKQLDQPQAQQALKKLDEILYKEKKNWDGNACWQAIEEALKSTRNEYKKTDSNKLPGLY